MSDKNLSDIVNDFKREGEKMLRDMHDAGQYQEPKLIPNYTAKDLGQSEPQPKAPKLIKGKLYIPQKCSCGKVNMPYQSNVDDNVTPTKIPKVEPPKDDLDKYGEVYKIRKGEKWKVKSKPEFRDPPQSDLNNLKVEMRKIIRDYYNTTFEYAIEQLEKGDMSAMIANAETKQKALDDPYLDKLITLFSDYLNRVIPEIIGEDDNPPLCPPYLHQEGTYPECDDRDEHTRNFLRAEQRKKWDEIHKRIKGEL